MAHIIGKPAAEVRAWIRSMEREQLKALVKSLAKTLEIKLPAKPKASLINAWLDNISDRELHHGLLVAEKTGHLTTENGMQATVIDEALVKRVYEDLMASAQQIFANHGLLLHTIPPIWFAGKINYRFDAVAPQGMRASWFANHARYKLRLEWLGRMVRLGGNKYRVAGINPTLTKDQVLVRDQAGRTYHANPFTVSMLLAAEDAAEAAD